MKDFTIFKTGSQRGVNTFMSGEGAIEHPMSTHSVPFGTSWKARGLRYVASILMILTLCVGNAWGAYYGTGRVVAVRFGGNDANFGKVGCKTTTGTNGVDYNGGTYAVDFTNYSNTQSYSSTSSTKVYIVCFAREIEGSGYSFAGWYTDPSCAEGYEAPSANISGWEPTSTQQRTVIKRD